VTGMELRVNTRPAPTRTVSRKNEPVHADESVAVETGPVPSRGEYHCVVPDSQFSENATRLHPGQVEPVHERVGDGHAVDSQRPATHARPAPHTVPQLPQLLFELVTFNSQPLVATPSQFAKLVEQVRPQVLAAHVAVEFAPLAQMAPHAPQLVSEVAVSTHVPLQRVCPAGHGVATHAPAEHICPAAQAVPHAPQLAAEVARLVSQPFAAMLSQLPNPAEHVNPHTLAAHVATAPAGTAHATPHEPQFATEVAVSTHTPAHRV
jgi:hypothetical protein